jgi:serine/threonine-protein kinase
VDRRADVFAVGVMLWQGIVTTGAAQSKSHQLAGPDSARADIDPGLFAIVERAMTADPAGRYPTALAMRTELESHAKRARLALPDTRALAAFVLPLFVKKRQQRQAIIDTQLGILQGPGGEAPSTAAWLGLATTPAAPSMTRAARFAPDSLAPTEAATPDPGPVARETPGVTSPSAPMDVPSAQESGRGGGAGRFALAAFCGVLAAVATVLLSSGRSSPLAAEVVRGASEQGTTPPTAVRATPRPEPDEAIVSNAEPPAKAPVRRSPPSPVVAHAAPPASPPSRAAPAASVKTPAARATPASSTPLFAIDAPAAKPVRDIDKQDPYLQ